MNDLQSDQCKRLAQNLRAAFPDSDVPSLIESAQYIREKNVNRAIECLEVRFTDRLRDAYMLVCNKYRLLNSVLTQYFQA